MKSKVLVLAVGLAAAGIVAAVMLFTESSMLVESSPEAVEHEPAAANAPVRQLGPPPSAALETRDQALAAEQRSEVAAPVIRGRVVEADGGSLGLGSSSSSNRAAP